MRMSFFIFTFILIQKLKRKLMKTRFIFSCLLFISLVYACRNEDDTLPQTSLPTNLGRVEFNTVLCTNLDEDPVCTDSFAVLPSVRIFVYETEEDREFADPVFASPITNEEGQARIFNMEGGTYFFRADSPVSEEFIEDSFSVNNNSQANVRLEYKEE